MLLRMWKVLTIILLTGSGIAAAGVYRWVDENGQIHFSDKAQAGAEQIKLKETSIYTPPAESNSGAADQTEQAKGTVDANTAPKAVVDYEVISVVSPENNQVVRSTEGTVDISVELRPGLQQGHKIRVYLNGTKAAQDLETTQITLQNMDRGTHSLEVSVIDEKNNELKRSSAVSFHMLRLAEPRTAPFGGGASEG
ncbi:MAG: DUF4124 domain-containing protein [Chromatiaceae bacterium]|nr:DUF4124 domain-containing protein [Gammaproteobacteria bacterium]MCP5447152.1 DUF4124 domain-containing protein [Chromatiaceae bacterium]